MEKIKITDADYRNLLPMTSDPFANGSRPIVRVRRSVPIVSSHNVKAKFVSDVQKPKELRDGWLFTLSLLCLIAGGILAVGYLMTLLG